MITVVNKKTHKPTNLDVYIGRPTALGNPYDLKNFSREDSIRFYRHEFLEMMEKKQDTLHLNYLECRAQLKRIWELHKKGNVYLVCWCKPLACHGDIIKEFLDSLI